MTEDKQIHQDPLEGFFTPTAQVLCAPCNNKYVKFDYEKSWAKTLPIVRRPETDRVGVCDDCGCPVGLDREDVYICQKFVIALREIGYINATLEQTGGMCVAASLNREDDAKFFFAVLDENTEQTALTIGFYEDDAQFDDGEQIEGLEGATIEAAISFVEILTS